MTDGKEPSYLDTLAAALAAAGKFEEAAEQQRQAVELAAEAEKADYQARLAQYEAVLSHKRNDCKMRISPPKRFNTSEHENLHKFPGLPPTDAVHCTERNRRPRILPQ